MSCNCGSCASCSSLYSLPTGNDGSNGATGAAGAEGKGYATIIAEAINMATLPTTLNVTVAINLAYVPGSRIRVTDDDNPGVNYFEGIVISYNILTGAMVIDLIDIIVGSGTIASTKGNVNIAGEKPLDSYELLFSSGTNSIHSASTGVETLKTFIMSSGTVVNIGDMLKVKVTFFLEDGTQQNIARFQWGAVGSPATAFLNLDQFTSPVTTKVDMELSLINLGGALWTARGVSLLSPGATGQQNVSFTGLPSGSAMSTTTVIPNGVDPTISDIEFKATIDHQAGVGTNNLVNYMTIELHRKQ